jgi:ribose transport system permease protein
MLKFSVFALSGLLAGVAGLIGTVRYGYATPNTGTGYELQAIAAVVIGGTSLMGGRGSVLSSLFGVSIIAVLAHGLTLTHTGDPTKRLITGAVIVLAVIIDYYRHRLRKTAN